MKITIINPSPDEEEEIIIKCRVLTDDINHLICKLKTGIGNYGYDAKGITLLALGYFFYFEATDNKVFCLDKRMFMKLKKTVSVRRTAGVFSIYAGLQIHDSKSDKNPASVACFCRQI